MSHIYIEIIEIEGGVETRKRVNIHDVAEELYLAIQTRLDPPQITADVQDYEPTDWANKKNIFLDFDGPKNIGGLKALPDLTQRKLHNQSMSDQTIVHLDAGSTAGNKVQCPGGVNYTFLGCGVLPIIYDENADSGNGAWIFN